MAGDARSILTIERICVTSTATDPRQEAILRSGHDLGIHELCGVEIADLVFIRGDLTDDTRGVIQDLLVDPLVQQGIWQQGIWVEPEYSLGRVVETARIPGVTDSVTDELRHLAERMALPITGVASGKRFVLHGDLDDDHLNRLVATLLANPIIERWTIDAPITPVFVENDAAVDSTVNTSVESVAIDARTTQAELQRINHDRGLALDPAELLAIQRHFAEQSRLPTDVELETIAQTWSEHCSHKTFRAAITLADSTRRLPLLTQLRNATDEIAAKFVRSAFVGNAGIISFTPRRTIALKCETHNHPSAIEPFGGANTGVGGVIRDVLGSAHQPIACTNILCFGPPDIDARTIPRGVFPPRRTRAGVVSGIADYGNKIGLPTVAGAVLYDLGYTANPLVYAGCIGVATDYIDQQPPQPGDRVIVLGGRTGRDGLRGATFSSRTMDATTGDVSGASVQIGDPITEKLLIDVLAEARHLYRAITDCGAGGLSSAIGEMAEGVGADIELAHVPLKYPGLAPWEIWLSEAQERMVLAVPPQDCAALQQLCALHGAEYVQYTDVGRFTGDNQLVVRFQTQTVLHLDTHFLHHGRPQRQMTAVMPTPNRSTPTRAPEWLLAQSPTSLLLALLSHPNIASKASIIHCYDHEIRGATIVRPLVGEFGDGHGDGVVLAEPTDDFGIAIGIGVNPWFGLLDAERMAFAVIDEAMRNVVSVGADPDRVALLDNFSWGDPLRPDTLGELVAAVDGCCAAARAFAAPFVSGKDSLNNEYLGSDGQRHAVPPTLVITAVAHVPDVHATVTSDLKAANNVLLLLGNTRPEFGGSHSALVGGAPDDGVVPQFDLAAPARYRALHTAIRAGLIRACHDCSEGGVAVAVAEMAIGGRLGVRFNSIGDAVAAAELLFSESLGRLVIEVTMDDVVAVQQLIAEPITHIGHVTAEQSLVLPDGSSIKLETLLTAWQSEQ